MKISVPFDELKHVVHISDVHIRLFQRHREYRESFRRLYSDIKSKNLTNAVIVLAGDIVHAKTDMSPEMVSLTSEFLSNLSDIAPVIMIAGNHDLNLSNPNRLDSLSPIVDNLNHPNLHYAKYSQILTVADTDFAIFSVVDHEWPSVGDCKSKNKVALFHGPVDGSYAGSFSIDYNRYKVEMFDGFDMVMMGDIHSHQVLQTRNKTWDKPIVVYSSSLIQQNHGEPLEGHGWCLWDIKKQNMEFVPLVNEYGYVTLEVDNGNITFPTAMPSKPRIRLFTGNMTAADITKLISSIKDKYDVEELSVNKHRLKKTVANKSVLPVHAALNLSDPVVQNQLIQDWLLRNHPMLDTEIIGTINKLNRELNSKISHDDQSRNINWRPLHFKFSNMFSYGEDNEVNFQDMGGVYGLFAENAMGKSSLMDAFMFCLYDKTPRAFKGDHILNNRKDSFTCELLFQINNDVFGIKRIGSKKRDGAVKVDVEFWKQNNNGDVTSLNGESRRDTNANIRNYIGTYEDFIMTAFSGQLNTSLFIDKSHSERKDLLIQFMGLNVFDKLYVLANEEAKEISGVLKRFKKEEVTDSIVNISNSLSEMKEEIKNTEESMESTQDTLDSIEKEIQELIASMKPVPSTSFTNIDDLKTAIDEEQELLARLGDDYIISGEYLQNLGYDLIEQKESLEKYDVEQIKKDVSDSEILSEKIKSVTRNIKLLNTRLSERQKFRSSLDQYKYNPDCNVCVENNRVLINDTAEADEDIETITRTINEETLVLKKANDDLESLNPSLVAYKEILWIEENISTIENDIKEHEIKQSQIEVKIEKGRARAKSLTEEINIFNENKEAITHNLEIENKLSEQKELRAETKSTHDALNKGLRKLHSDQSVLVNKKSDLQDKLKEAEELSIEHQSYTHYLGAIGRNGVPYDIISKTIPSIEAEINDILAQVVKFKVSLDVDHKNINGKMIYDYDRIWPLENSSGMERFISSLAIRVALMNASNLPKPNFLIIDEGFGVLDAEHLHSMQTLFNLLKSNFDFILIVSHLDTARDMVDNLIEIHKEDGYSQIIA